MARLSALSATSSSLVSLSSSKNSVPTLFDSFVKVQRFDLLTSNSRSFREINATDDHKMNEQHKHILQILSKLHDKDKAVRASVVKDVKELDADGEQTLLSFLQSSDGEQKCDAAFALCLLDADK